MGPLWPRMTAAASAIDVLWSAAASRTRGGKSEVSEVATSASNAWMRAAKRFLTARASFRTFARRSYSRFNSWTRSRGSDGLPLACAAVMRARV